MNRFFAHLICRSVEFFVVVGILQAMQVIELL